MNFSRFFKAHEVLNKILKELDDTIRNSILVTWYSLMELPMHQTIKCIVYVTVLFDVMICDHLCYIYKLYCHYINYQGYVYIYK